MWNFNSIRLIARNTQINIFCIQILQEIAIILENKQNMINDVTDDKINSL